MSEEPQPPHVVFELIPSVAANFLTSRLVLWRPGWPRKYLTTSCESECQNTPKQWWNQSVSCYIGSSMLLRREIGAKNASKHSLYQADVLQQPTRTCLWEPCFHADFPFWTGFMYVIMFISYFIFNTRTEAFWMTYQPNTIKTEATKGQKIIATSCPIHCSSPWGPRQDQLQPGHISRGIESPFNKRSKSQPSLSNMPIWRFQTYLWFTS